MAAKTQIGAVIGIDGAKEYQNQLKLLVQFTKEWKSETDKLTSSFDKNDKSMANVAKERKAIETEIDSLNKVLKLQTSRWEELATSMNTTPTAKEEMEFSKLRTSINKTEIKINNLKNRLKELPKDNFFAKKEYIKNAEDLSHKTDTLVAKTKALGASMSLNGTTMSGIQAKGTLLQSQITVLNQQLDLQKKRYEYLTIAMKGTPTEEERQEFHKLGVEIYNTAEQIDNLQKEYKELSEETTLTTFFKAWDDSTSKQGEALKRIGDGLTKYVTVPIAGAGIAMIKVASDFESSFTGVRKTVDGTTEELGALKKELMEIPLETASSTETVMAVAEAAGQLNVPIGQIAEFTKYVIMLGDSTNITAEEGSTSIARFMNIMGVNLNEGVDDVNRFGSSLVALGNNTATDEESILALSLRLASAGKLAGLTIPEILGLSAAMSSVGLTAEAGGTAMSTTINLIAKDVAKGGENLDKFAKVAGMTSEEFAEKWRTNAVGALQDLLIGMSNLSEDGGAELLEFMDEVGWSGIRQSDTMRRLASDYDGVSEAVRIANENFQTNEEALDGSNALTDEATKRYEDFNSQLSQLKESVKQLAAAFGEELIPLIKPIIDDATEMIKHFSEMDDKTKKNIISFLGLAAVIGPVLSIGGNLLIWVAKLKDAFGVLKGAEGVGGAIEALGGGTAGGGLIATLEGVASSIADKVVPAIIGNGGASLGGALALLGVSFGGAYAAASAMDQKMYESAEACEYVASRYHWSEEKVNEFGYTWDENGHLVELANKGMTDNTDKTVEDMLMDIDEMKRRAREKTQQGITDVNNEVKWRIPEVQTTSHKMVWTAVEEMQSASSQATGYGSEMGQNFANGISSSSSWVERAVSGLANIARRYLHFTEPDVGPLSNFHTWMPDMMRQMANGIYDNMYLVEGALGSLSQGMANQLNGGTTYQYGGVNIILNVPQGANGTQIVDQIEKELANRTIRRKAVFA